jgi:hypothetical protein
VVQGTGDLPRGSFPLFAELQGFELVVLLGIFAGSGLFWWGEMGFARREDPRKNEKHGQGAGGRVVSVLSHVSQSSRESQVTVEHLCPLEQSNPGASLSWTRIRTTVWLFFLEQVLTIHETTRLCMSVGLGEYLLLKCIPYF